MFQAEDSRCERFLGVCTSQTLRGGLCGWNGWRVQDGTEGGERDREPLWGPSGHGEDFSSSACDWKVSEGSQQGSDVIFRCTPGCGAESRLWATGPSRRQVGQLSQ